MYDVKNDKLFLTDELYRIYGLEPQVTELGWQQFMEMVHEDDREVVSAFVAEVTKTAKPFEMYHRNIRKDDGTIRTLHVRGEGLKDDNGNVYQLFGTTQDVTEQQRIEQELRENQNFIKKIADATPSIITTYNINTGKYHFISQGIRTLLGYEPEEGLENGVAFFSALIHPDDVVGIMQKNAKALETANSPENEDTDIIVDFQYRMKRKDGEYRWFHTFGTVFDRNTYGKVENVLNISIDITDRIRAEETVAEQQRFISHIAEASPTILYLFDLEQKKFLYLNKEVTAVLGYTPEEILSLGDKVYMYLHPEDTIKSPDTYVKYKHEGSATMHQFEGRIKSRAGEWKWLLTREVVFKRNEDGQAIQVLGSALDISDRKEMEGSLSKKNLELEQSNANLEEFAYVASHDLQEPLRKISIFGDRLLVNHTESLNDDGKLFLQKIVDSSKRMQGMINDLLSVSLISGNKSFEQYSLKAVLHDVVQTLEFKIEARNAQVLVDDLPVARIIPSQMRQLFQNLISNSLKFVAAGRNPEIRITQAPVKHMDLVNYNLSTARQYIRVDVADNGIGFDNAYASKIFTIFQRLHGKAEYEGTGIGLAICKKIVENHEGVIFAEGKPGEGSVFSIILPV
jgi:PAS domain S-box-containing protein